MEFDKEKIVSALTEVIAGVLKEGGEKIAHQSRHQVPKKTGALKDSCKVEKTDELSVEVGYDSNYAAKVHEDMTAKHENGKAKFLQEPFNEQVHNVIADAAQEIKKVTK